MKGTDSVLVVVVDAVGVPEPASRLSEEHKLALSEGAPIPKLRASERSFDMVSRWRILVLCIKSQGPAKYYRTRQVLKDYY